MSSSNRKNKRQRDRQKEWEKKRRSPVPPAAATPVRAARGQIAPASEMLKWPVVHSFVPVPDVFRATGFGTAAIVRERPDGTWISSFFEISLLDDGIKIMAGSDSTDQVKLDEFVERTRPLIPPMEPGPAHLAARYIWGAYAMSVLAGFRYPGEKHKRYLGLVPPIPGSMDSWRQQLTGYNGLADPGLVRYLAKHPTPEEVPDDKEVMVFTRARFSVEDSNAVRAELDKRAPEFIFDGEDDAGVALFTWSREYPKRHWSPLSRLGGRQTLGSVEIGDDYLVAEAKVLSMCSILIGKLKDAFGQSIRLIETSWKHSDDLIREAREDRGE